MTHAIRAMIKGVRKAALNPIQRRTPVTCLTLGNPPGPQRIAPFYGKCAQDVKH